MNSKFNDKLDNLGTFFNGLKEDDVILLQNDKDTSYNEENASNLYHCFLHLKNKKSFKTSKKISRRAGIVLDSFYND